MDIPRLVVENIPTWLALVLLGVNTAIGLVALGTVPHGRRPAAGWAWLVVIVAFPVLGILAYLLLGRAELPAERTRRQRAALSLVDDGGAPEGGGPHGGGPVPDAPRWVRDAVALNDANGAFPLVGGNGVEILDDYAASLAAMAREIDAARQTVHAEFYIAAADPTTEPVLAALERAHRRGVAVRVLVDHLGSRGFPGHRGFQRRLDAAGIPRRLMLPVRPWRGQYQRPDLRNHRKILAVDGRVAFAGSQNLIDRSYNKARNRRRGLQWTGLMLRIEGPAAAHLDALFAADWWCEAGDPPDGTPVRPPAPLPEGVPCQLLPSGPAGEQESSLQLFTHVFASAARRITVCTPYYVPDDSMETALRTAVGRGVEVVMLLGETSSHRVTHHAQRSYYEELLRSGVRVFLYPAPWVLHAKFVVADGEAAVVGSSNMDLRSFALNHELNLLIPDRGTARRLERVADGYREASAELGLGEWLARPHRERYLDNAARLTSALQ